MPDDLGPSAGGSAHQCQCQCQCQRVNQESCSNAVQTDADVSSEERTNTNVSEGESSQPRDAEGHLPGYTEACVIAANNLRELDMKALATRVKLRFVSTGATLMICGFILALLEILEINLAGDQACLGMGIWAGCLFILSGGVSVRVGRAKSVSYCSMTSTVFFEYLGMGFLIACLVFGLRDWMCFGYDYFNIYFIWQFIHIGKFATTILVMLLVVMLTVSYLRFFAKYRAHRMSTAEDPTITTRTVSLFSVLDELRNDDDDVPKYVEPPPAYASVVVDGATPNAEQAVPSPPTDDSTPHSIVNVLYVALDDSHGGSNLHNSSPDDRA